MTPPVHTIHKAIHPMRWGLVLSLLTLLYGFGLGALMGANEDAIKDHLKNEGEAALTSAYKGDEAKMQATVSKSWVYFKRAHLHANGLGTTALALIAVIAWLPGSCVLRGLVAFAGGAGGLGYGLFWMLAGLRAPALGGTGPAKATLEWLALPSAGLCILAVLGTLALVLRSWRRTPSAPTFEV